MKHHHGHLIVTDMTTELTANFNEMGVETRQFRLQFTNPGSFKSESDLRDALHRQASDHALMLHHNHPEFLPEDLREVDHDGQPAYVMTVRRCAM